jgi:hypothetical protein
MQIRHEETLTSRLEEAALHGCAHITWEEMYLWYSVQKIAAGTWRDLARRWDKVLESIKATKIPDWTDPGKLIRTHDRGGFFILGDKLIRQVD